MEHIDTEDIIEQLDVEIRDYLEYHQLPQWFVNIIAENYLNVTYIRQRIREIYPEFFREIKPLIQAH